ncbi:hypothetical protein TNCV_4514121 [Trichonephila clavipes]|nr:hypothetical protein TNCV_4514121 [Trichonephila clavipes]
MAHSWTLPKALALVFLVTSSPSIYTPALRQLTLMALSNYNENNCLRVQNCRELLGKIVFQWVPSHCGLWGNERGQTLGQKGNGYPSELSQRPDISFCQTEIKRIFRESFRLTASRVARDNP